MSDNKIELELKSTIDNVLSKLSYELKRIINVEPETGSQDVNIDGNASANFQYKWTYKRRREKFYYEHVMSKIGKEDKKKVVMNLSGFYLQEHLFVDCFKPDGWLSNFVVCSLSNLWNREWGDKTIISHLAVQELLEDNGDRLATELDKEVLGRTKLIFIPIHANNHWNLAGLDLIKKQKCVIDSMESIASLATANNVLSKVEDYLKKFAISGFKRVNQKVKKQGNCNDCGFHMLLFIQELHRLGLSLEFDGVDAMKFDGPRILRFRQELVWLILNHPDNRPYTEGSSTTPNLSLDDSEVICQNQPVI